MYGKTHVGILFIFLVYLFISFDLENVGLASIERSLNWAWSLRGLVIGVSDQTKLAFSFFEALQKHG